MNTKRFILMLLVALMSVTTFSAEAQNSIPYQIVSASEGFRAGANNCWLFNGNTGQVIVETGKKYKITSCCFPLSLGYLGDARKVILYGSNDNATWIQLATYNLTGSESRNVSVMSSVAYRYYRVDYSEPYTAGYSLSAGILDLRTDEPVIKGFGTEENPFIIESAIDFHTLTNYQTDLGSFYAKVNNDIDFSDVQSWESVDLSATPFVLDGNCKELKNLIGTNGLFSSINGATIKNLGMVDAIINTDAECCGFLSTTATNSTFTNCYVIGDFTNTNASATNGALVGRAEGATTFSKCYAVTNLEKDDEEIRPTFVSTETPGHYSNLDASMLVDETGTTNEWCTPTSAKVNGVWNIVVSTNHPTTLKTIKLWNARNTQTNYGRTWKKVKVYGSNTANGSWGEPIGDFDNLSLAINNYGFAGDLEINATKAYTYYKIDVLENKGGTGDDYMQMADMKFVVGTQNVDVQDLQHLPICGVKSGETSLTDCMYYGDGMDKSYVSSGFIAYHINRSDLPSGPYYQKIGSDLYPHLNCTGDNYVYAIDNYTFTNSCTHQLKNHTIFKAPACDDNSGHVEYYQCQNELCQALIRVDGRIFEDEKELVLSMTPIVIKDSEKWGHGRWSIKDKITKGGKAYYDVAEVTVEEVAFFSGDRSVQYTFLDSKSDSLNVHAFFSGKIDSKTQGLRFFVNGVERKDLAYEMNEGGDKHCVTVIKSLNKYDVIKIVYYNNITTNSGDLTTLSIALEHSHKPGNAHDIQRIPTVYDCMTGGYLEHNVCVKCGLEFFDREDEEKELESMNHEFFLQEYFLQPTGQHDYVLSHQTTELGLLKYACQRYTCHGFSPDHFGIPNCFGTNVISITKSGDTYTADDDIVSMPDAVAYNSPVSFNVNSLTYSRTFYPNVWNPWFVPFNTTVEELADNGVTDVACIESIHNYDTDMDGVVDKTVLEVILKKNGTVKAGVPYMVKTGDSYTYPMVFTDREMDASTNAKTVHTETASAAYDFMGTYSGLTAADLASSNHYSLNEEGKMVHRTLNILPQRWYMKEVGKENVYEELSPAMARAFAIRVIGEEDETTGIRTIYPEDGQKEERLPEGIFDLNGRKLSAPHSGQINIINGKKQFVR